MFQNPDFGTDRKRRISASHPCQNSHLSDRSVTFCIRLFGRSGLAFAAASDLFASARLSGGMPGPAAAWTDPSAPGHAVPRCTLKRGSASAEAGVGRVPSSEAGVGRVPSIPRTAAWDGTDEQGFQTEGFKRAGG